MASYKFHFRPSKRAGSDKGKLFVRIIHNRKSKEIPTPHSVSSTEWDAKHGKLIFNGSDLVRTKYLKEVDVYIRRILSTLRMVNDLMETRGEYDTSDFIESYRSLTGKSNNLLSFTERTTVKMISDGHGRTARAYRSAVRSIVQFNDGRIVYLEDITASTMREYEGYLYKKGLSKNTISFYMRNLRALYYRAIDEKLITAQDDNPFSNVLTGVYQSRKRSLDLNDVRALQLLQKKLSDPVSTDKLRITKPMGKRKLNKAKGLLNAMHYFRFCLEARGMSWVDMVYLKKNAIRSDTFIYKRKKTGQELEIIITPSMREIIDYFSRLTPASSPYVFPILDPDRGNERVQYETGLRMQNSRLKEVSKLAGVTKQITTHVSRHSWATIAKREKIEIAVISELLGHNNIKTTMRYLASFDKTDMEKATKQVSSAIKKAS